MAAYLSAEREDFLVAATPGAGKTTSALAIAAELRRARRLDRVIVVTPTDHLRTQWAQAAGRFALRLDPDLPNSVGPIRDGSHGCVVTYAQVAAAPMLHRARTEARRTLVVLDEIHHAGDGLSWGEAVYEAFSPARRRLALTGTPFRTLPTERIPFVRYEPDPDLGAEDGTLRSVADYSYGYRDGLADGVVRPVIFAAYSGVSRWRTSAGDVVAMGLSEARSRSAESAAWRTALSPRGRWLPHVLAAADHRLTEKRESGFPDAAGMVLAGDQDSARAYAAVLQRTTGHEPLVVVSDDPDASRRIAQFRESRQRWLVAVRMVSEGVDIPRLSVGVYATSARTPLFFAQAVGRFVRRRGPGETATVFLPAVRPLLAMAAELERERNHVLGPPQEPEEGDGAWDDVPEEPTVPSARSPFEALDAQAAFAHVVYAGAAHSGDTPGPGPHQAGSGTGSGPAVGEAGHAPGVAAGSVVSPEEEDFLGLPGLLTPQQTAVLLRQRDDQIRARTTSADPGRNRTGGSGTLTSAEQAAGLRKEIHSLVAQVARRTGQPHARIHAALRREVPGPGSATAGADVLSARRDRLLQMLH